MMVFQKKGGFKTKQQTPAKQKGRKSANADFQIEQGSDDSEKDQLVNTPAGKTPKGKQSLGDKRVSFQVPGKNTPKTPKNENSLVRKQPTPGKPSALKEFKGLVQNNSKQKQNNQKQAKQPTDDDDDDDDDDEDDDEDIDLDLLDDDDDDDDDDEDDSEDDNQPQKMKGLQQKQMSNTQKMQNKVLAKNPEKSPEKNKVSDNIEKESSEDDDDDDDDDMDMLDSEDDSEEEEKPQQKRQNQMNNSQKQVLVQENKTSKKEKSPVKNEKNISVGQTQSMVSSKKPEKKNEKSAGYQKAVELTEERKKERDIRTLYIGNLPKDITHSELKALSTDVTNVNIPILHAKKRKTAFAFLEFANEAKAEENYKLLKTKKIRGQSINIDFTGSKRQNNVQKDENTNINLKRLFVSSIPVETTIDKIALLFPKSVNIQLNISPVYRNATVNFITEEDAADALEKSKNAKIDGKSITVLYSISKDRPKKRKRSKGKKPAAKKQKMEAKEENTDDDDDDDDDDEEEEEEE